MSVTINGATTLVAFTSSIPQQVYLSTTYSLTGIPLFIQYKNPINVNINSNINIVSYVTDFGESALITTNPQDTVFYSYGHAGTYYISYSAIYNTGEKKIYTLNNPVNIKNNWDIYDQKQLRLNNEIVLNLPYSLEQVEIQPSEWGVEDIFNTAIYRLQDCLEYLISNTQTINTSSPTEYIGWLGNDSGSKVSIIKWYTKNYNSEYYNNPELATSLGYSYFSNIKDAKETNDHIFVLDGTRFRVFSAGANPIELNFSNSNEIASLLINPLSFDINDTGDTLFIVDAPVNKVYRFNLDLSNNPSINIELFTGGFGGTNDHNKYNSPTEICYNNKNVYVLDYNNFCVKQYNNDLNWLHTYSNEMFTINKPTSITIHPTLSLVYILTNTYKVYIFDNLNDNIFETIDVKEINDGYKIIKIEFDENGDFFYILTEQNAYKYSASGGYITTLNLTKTSNIKLKNVKATNNRSLIFSSDKCLLKFQDILEVFKLGEGLPYKYWTKDQLKVYSDEFSSDINYNRSLIRLSQNIKSFRDTLNAKFILASEQTTSGIVTYFSWIPINSVDLPKFEFDIENDTIGVGVNELHIPQVFNKEIKKLYSALLILNNFLNIENVYTNNLNCSGNFCWSWKALSCYNLTLPVIKTCDVNPITYRELETLFPIDYAPTKSWAQAHSDCCDF
jgi:hypothetical protein